MVRLMFQRLSFQSDDLEPLIIIQSTIDYTKRGVDACCD